MLRILRRRPCATRDPGDGILQIDFPI
jgi:hypothetical protein